MEKLVLLINNEIHYDNEKQVHNVLKSFRLIQELMFELFLLYQLTILVDHHLLNNKDLGIINKHHEHKDVMYQHYLMNVVVLKDQNHRMVYVEHLLQ
jgi:hypothetical protein